MLWLCIALTQLPLEALRDDEPDKAVVVTDCTGSARWLVCCNEYAVRVGLKPALNYTMALAIHPQVISLGRKPRAEQAALQRLATWSYQFSSTVVVGEVPLQLEHARTAGLWLEIGASLKLFGGFRTFIERLEQELNLLGYTYQLGVAPTLEGAALLARAKIRVAITNVDALYKHIRHLPLSALLLTPDVVAQFDASGIRTVCALLELPRDAVAKRFGTHLGNLLDRLMGAAADPRPAFELPERYDVRFEFDQETRSTESMLFPLQRMLREFAGFLRARDSGVQRFTLALSHRNQPDTQLHIGLSTPDRNPGRFFDVTREQLERTELVEPALELRLSADQFTAPTALQPDMFNAAFQEAETLSHTLDRMTARLGEEALHAVSMVAEHRPESSWTAKVIGTRSPSMQFPPRPLWLLPEPKPLQLTALGSLISSAERIESGWWDGGDVQRDYFIMHTQDGADLWVFHDLSNDSWHLHGIWS